MRIKGSPRDKVWYGQRSMPEGPVFLCLNSIPLACPRIRKPNKVKLTQTALASLDGEKMRAYCGDVERLPMHSNLMQFARTLIVPSLGPATEADLRTISPERRKKMMVQYN